MTENTTVKFKRRKVQDETENLENLTKDDLIKLVKQLKATNQQMKNMMKAKKEVNQIRSRKSFDFSVVGKRHILLKFLYLGWDYQGYVVQDCTSATIENHLFDALKKCCLIENRETSNYHRCGRTDKGVSAFCQVISIDVRSRHQNPDETNCENELPYCTMLNRILPKQIRVYAWTHVDSTFSARFNCLSRTYKYFFPKGDLDVSAMREASQLLVGEHDFRNFCKMDVANGVTNFVRNVTSVKIEQCDITDIMYELTITASGFLWHQIRYIMGILLLIGQNREPPSIVDKLLDTDNVPCKPQYNMASDLPLNLFYCDYNVENSKWCLDETNLIEVINTLQTQWVFSNIKTTMISKIIKELKELSSTKDVILDSNILIQGVKPRVYKELLNREKCESLESRIQHYVKKEKLITS